MIQLQDRFWHILGGKTTLKPNLTEFLKQSDSRALLFKPFVYAAAMEKGLTPFTKYKDKPIKIGNWSPGNYGGKYRGQIPLYKALAYSSNSVAVQLIQDVGVEDVIRMANRLGITTPIANDPTIALGSSAVKLIDMATAYGRIC